MIHRSLRRAFAPSLAAFLLLAPAAHAAGPASRASTRAVAGSILLSFLGPWAVRLAAFWEKEGCSIDPSGHCPARFVSDNGCSIDPNGSCRDDKALPAGQAGCSIDPDGCSQVAPAGDAGCSIDPNGHCLPGH